MKKYSVNILTILSMLLFCATNGFCQTFDEYFTDKTLRIDYIFSGNAKQQTISLDKLNTMPRWYGKRQRLAQVPVEGNGQITVRPHNSDKIIYRNSFSTLFQEWLSYDEAKTTSKSFENVFLVPMPKDTIDITVDLYNNRREKSATFTHTVAPSDILIRHIGEHDITPYKVIQQAADTTKCIHIAFVAEGYTKDEMNVFLNDVNIATEALFAHEPFKSKRKCFNIVAVESESKESGTSEPSRVYGRIRHCTLISTHSTVTDILRP